MKSRLLFYFLFFALLFSQTLSANTELNGSRAPQKAPCFKGNTSDIDYECIESQLNNEGLGGWVHAAVKDQSVFVFTWRHPNNFFINVQLPMSSKDPLVLKQISQLKRHDRIVVKGSFYKNEAPVQHINATDIEVVEPYQGLSGDYAYDPNLPESISKGSRLIGKVHATANEGKVLVVEVGDRVYPVFNKDPLLVKDLYRNDKIELQYFIPFVPNQPMHLEVDTEAKNPIRVIESIAIGHNDPIHLVGSLVMFPQSPQIIFNVYALRIEDMDGVKWDYTLVNFEDIDLFHKVRETLEAAWNSLSAEAKYDRNKFINPKIEVDVTGIKNVIDPGQANPQVIIKDIQNLKITFK